jgi:Pathogenicity locus
MNKKKPKSELLTLMNVGPAFLKDLQILGIETIEQLRFETPDNLYNYRKKARSVRVGYVCSDYS